MLPVLRMGTHLGSMGFYIRASSSCFFESNSCSVKRPWSRSSASFLICSVFKSSLLAGIVASRLKQRHNIVIRFTYKSKEQIFGWFLAQLHYFKKREEETIIRESSSCLYSRCVAKLSVVEVGFVAFCFAKLDIRESGVGGGVCRASFGRFNWRGAEDLFSHQDDAAVSPVKQVVKQKNE